MKSPSSNLSNRSSFLDTSHIPAIDADSDGDTPQQPTDLRDVDTQNLNNRHVNLVRNKCGPCLGSPNQEINYRSNNLAVPMMSYSSSDASSSSSRASGASSSVDNYTFLVSVAEHTPTDVNAKKKARFEKVFLSDVNQERCRSQKSQLAPPTSKSTVSCIVPPEPLLNSIKRTNATSRGENFDNVDSLADDSFHVSSL